MSNQRLVPLNVAALASAPAGTPKIGDLYYNTTNLKTWVYSSGGWVVAAGGGAAFQTSAPTGPQVGDIWVDSDAAINLLTPDDYALLSGPTFTGPSTVAVNSASTALTIKQTGAGNALVVEDSTSPDSTPFVIDASGNVGIGKTPIAKLDVSGTITTDNTSTSNRLIVDNSLSDAVIEFKNSGTRKSYMRDYGTGLLLVEEAAGQPIALTTGGTERMRITSAGNVGIGTTSPQTSLHVYKASIYEPQVQIENGSNDSSNPYILFKKGRAGAIVQNGDGAGYIGFQSWDGAQFLQTAGVYANIDGTPGTNDMPGRLVFSTTSDGASNPTERMRIDSAGITTIGTESQANTLVQIVSANNTAAQLRLIGDLSGTYGFLLKYEGNGNYFSISQDNAGALTEYLRIAASDGLISGSGKSLGAWTAYTPTLGGTGWAIGNGTAAGHYLQIGKVVMVRGIFTFGSTSTFGASSEPAVTNLPVTARTADFPVADVQFSDVSASAVYRGAPYMYGTSGFSFRFIGGNGVHSQTNATNPFPWATGDIIRFTGTYEAA